MHMRWTSLLGSRWSVSARAWAVSIPIGVVAAPLAALPEQDSARQVLQWLLIGLLAQIPLGAVLLVGARLLRHVAWPRTTAVAVTLAAGAARGLTIALVGHSHDSVVRVFASAITMAIWLQVIGAALESHERYQDEVAELLAALVARELHGRLLDESTTDAARAASAHRIAQTSGELRAIVDHGEEDHARTAALLQAAIETRLRPLSHDLWFSPRPVAPEASHRGAVVRRILVARVPVAQLSIASVLLLTWGAFVLHGVWQGGMVGLAVALGYTLVLLLAQASKRWPWPSAVVRYLGSAVLPALAGGLVIAAYSLGQMLSTVAVALGLPLITLGVAAAVTLSTDRAAIIADLRARLAEPDWDRHLGELVRREIDAHTATTLHNSVQPALTAAALQLQLAATQGDPARAREALGRAARAIDEAERRVANEPSGRERIENAAQAWSGIAHVELELPEGDLTPREWSLLADVVGESIANAVRHGKATSITIRIGVDTTTVQVTITDNGGPVSENWVAGLGSSWLSTVVDSRAETIDPEGRRSRSMSLARAAAST